MLQNRYGDHEFPVRDRWSQVRPYRAAQARREPNRAALRNLARNAPAIVVVVLGAGAILDGPGPDGPGGGVRVLAAVVLTVLAIAVTVLVSGLIDRGAPRREQERYRRLTGNEDVTERQQQLLALDAQSDYAIGAWNSSLGYGPAWSRMPADLRRRFEHDAKRPFFATMPLFQVEDLRARLDANEHIASGGDVELFVADAFAEASISARFSTVLHGADGERMLARVASLTGTSQWDLRALVEPTATGPARLLRAADAQRVIAVVRMAHLAEHVDAGTAWRLIERASEPAAGLYASWDDYWAGVRIGLAFWTDSLDAVQRFDRALAGLRASDWPATRAPFPTGPVPAWLPAITAPDPARTPDDPA